MSEAHAIAEAPLTRDELYGWLARMWERYQAEQADRKEPECDDSTDSE